MKLGVFVFAAALALIGVSAAVADEPRIVVLASKALSAQKYDEVVRLSTEGLSDSRLPKSQQTTLLTLRGSALVWLGRTADAETNFADAIALAPDKDARGSAVAYASGTYEEYGEHLFADHQYEKAVASFAAAENYVTDNDDTFNWHIVALAANNELDKAIEVCSARIMQNASANNFYRRAWLEEAKLDDADAIGDYSAALRVDPKALGALEGRGRLYVLLKQYGLARRDLESAHSFAAEDAGDDVLAVMWLHILHMKTQQEDDAWLRKSVAKLDENQWPVPALDYFQGKKSANQIVDIAQHSKNTIYFRQSCDAWFYLGEDALSHGKADEARALFHRTVSECTPEDFEWSAAMMELRQLHD